MFYHLILLGPKQIGFHTVTTDFTVFMQTKAHVLTQVQTLPVPVGVHVWSSSTLASWSAIQAYDPYFTGVSLAVDLRSFCQQVASESVGKPTRTQPDD